MRMDGYTFSEISLKLNKPRGTIYSWTKDTKPTKKGEYRLLNRKRLAIAECSKIRSKKCEENRKLYRMAGFRGSGIDVSKKNILWAIGASLYWGEGVKKNNQCIFTNSDPAMLRIFIRFLTDCLNVKRENISLSVYAYSNSDVSDSELEKFWVSETGISRIGGIYRNKAKTQKTSNRFGVARISIWDVSVVQKIYGAIDKIAPDRKKEWT